LNSTKFVFLLGPTSVGKGFIIKLILRICAILTGISRLNIGLISFGQIIRDKLGSDPAFRAAYGSIVARGDLVDDDKAIELFEEKLADIMDDGESGRPDIILVDGFCRSETQIQHAAQNGYLRKQDKVFIIEASLETCLARFLHRNAHDTSRIDSEMQTFRRRYHLHSDGISTLRALFKESNAEVIDIDGDKDIAEFVFPELFGHILAYDIAPQGVLGADETAEEARR
jgi:adenylate kinase family enzyme